jgi:hypothetical protein
MKKGIDSDYGWLMTHLEFAKGIPSRDLLALKMTKHLSDRIQCGKLPYTLGIFGGWGTGKTTILAMLAKNLEQHKNYKVVYFNSWKYAGFMEIVPALIYKVLQYGLEGQNVERDEAARRVILALGKKYSDQIGDWAKTKIGVNPVELFRDLYDVPDAVQRGVAGGATETMPQVVRAYYTQVDKAQDELRAALGVVVPGEEPRSTVVVLIDELDRCDPDEAFNVIKQMRVLFGMRDLPVVFVIAANAEPIGLAIKHRYGLESDTSDYEARRILEKFVDSYEDLSATESLGLLIQEMWQKVSLPWIIQIDNANQKPKFTDDVVKNASAFDVITTSIPLFSNIRVLSKSYEHVRNNTEINRHLLWTEWLLEIAQQIDPRFRRDIRTVTGQIEKSVFLAYQSLHDVSYRLSNFGSIMKIEYETNQKGNTTFSIFRTFFWEHAREELERIKESKDPEDMERTTAFQKLLSDPLRVDIVVLLSLLPLKNVPSFEELCQDSGQCVLPDFTDALETLIDEFGYILAN